MAPDTPRRSVIQSESSRTTGSSSDARLAETQHQRGHQLVHRNAAIVATDNIAQDKLFKNVHITGLSNNGQQHAIGCEKLHINIERSQLTRYCIARVHRELGDQFIVARNRKLLWSMMAILRIVREIKHHDVISSGIFADEFCDKRPWEWTKQALKTLEKAAEL